MLSTEELDFLIRAKFLQTSDEYPFRRDSQILGRRVASLHVARVEIPVSVCEM